MGWSLGVGGRWGLTVPLSFSTALSPKCGRTQWPVWLGVSGVALKL